MTEPEPLQQIARTYVRYKGRKLSYFSGCDYFRLASHPKVIAGLQEGLKKYGLNVAASRLTTGNHVLYHKLEKALADFFGADAALLVSNGYGANLTVAQALAGNFSHALIDAQAHPSLADAARFLDCPVVQFAHRDADDLARSVRRCGPAAKLVLLTDGMFANDGAVAPLAEYLRVLPTDGLLLVDDAHGAGTLGETGKGSLEATGVSRRRIIQTITLSKAFGVSGGVVLATAGCRKKIVDRSRLFAGSTPLPLPLANAALAAVKVLKAGKQLRRRLWDNSEYVKLSLRSAGLALPQTSGPILSIAPGPGVVVSTLHRRLLAAGIYPSFIKYPGGPASGYFRFAISSEHTRRQLDALLQVLITASQECFGAGVISHCAASGQPACNRL